MSILAEVLNVIFVVMNSFGKLILAALGLAIIFGMMGIINLAHGEFIMVGAYATALTYHRGVPLAIAILLGGIFVGLFGLAIERVIIQHLYDRIIDSMVATWGLSLILIQSVLVIFGPSLRGVPTPFGAIRYGQFSTSTYNVFLTVMAMLLIIFTYLLFMRTEYGLQARATLQNEPIARTLGTDTPKIYSLTFGYGAFVTGLAGGLFAPTISIVPTLGGSFIVEAFVTVIVGGTNVIIGTPVSALSLSVINGTASQLGGTLAGRMALLGTAIIILRFLPQGISGYFEARYR